MALHSKLWGNIAHEETNTTISSIKEEMGEHKKAVISKRSNQEPGAAAAAQAAVNSCVNFRNELVREETNTVIDGIMEEMRELKKAVMTKRGNQELETKFKKGGKVYGHL